MLQFLTLDFQKKMHKLHIFEHDIKELFVRSSGPGGQNVNKVATCVALHHIPTGLQVKCQDTRSQRANRVKAWWLLVDQIEAYYKDIELKHVQRREKIKRQNRLKPLVLKEKILEEKRLRKQKKSSRRKITVIGPEDAF